MNALRIAAMLIGPAPDARMSLCIKSISRRLANVGQSGSSQTRQCCNSIR